MDMNIFESDDAALVFFDWLARFTESDSFDALSEGERRVLWDIEATLESNLPAIVAEDYKSAVAAATARIVSPDESE